MTAIGQSYRILQLHCLGVQAWLRVVEQPALLYAPAPREHKQLTLISMIGMEN